MKSKFKVEEKVLSVTRGLGIVILADANPEPFNPIVVRHTMPNGELRDSTYTAEGKFYTQDTYPDLFKDGDIHPLLNVPVRIPKRKVKKELVCFVNIYKQKDDSFSIGLPHLSEDRALEIANQSENIVAGPIAVPLSFEVEE